MRDVVNSKIQIVVLVLFFGVLLSGIFLPIYSDEVVTKFRIARLFLEEGNAVTLFPQCATTTGRAVSWMFYPAGILLSAIYAHLEPLGLRLSGIFLSLIWFALLAYWCFKQTDEWRRALNRFAGLISIASLGVLPYLWDLSRPEQFLMLAVLLLCLSALFPKKRISARAQGAVAAGLALLLSFFFYAHPKSMFYMPFSLAVVWFATANYHKAIRYGLLLFVVALCVEVFYYFSALGACQDAPNIQKILATNTLLPRLLFSSPIDFINAGYNNLMNFPDRVLAHLTFNTTYQSGWLPPTIGSFEALPYLNFVIYYSLGTFIVGVHILSILVFLVQLIRKQMSAPIILALLLVGSNVINAVFYNTQNFYAGIQFVPISIIITALLMHCWRSVKSSNIPTYVVYSTLLLLSMASMVTLLAFVTPGIIRNSSLAQSSLPGQPLSIPVLGTRAHLDSISKLGASCGIPADPTKNVVVDHMTYFAFLHNKQPIHVLYISEFGYGGDLTDGKLLPFLKGLNSPGLITRCEWVPNEFRQAQEKGNMGYCCVNFGKI